MAMKLMRQYSLPVVAVRLTQDASGPIVQLDLWVHDEGQQQVVGSRAVRLQEFGMRENSRSDPYLLVPSAARDFVGAWAGEELEPGRALWLHLVKPYGILGAIPWERDLVPTLGRPVLRLPDALPEPSRSTTSLTVAIVATAPAAEGPPPALLLGNPVASTLHSLLGDRLNLHVFADSGTRPHLEGELRAQGLNRVEVHNPKEGTIERRNANYRTDGLRSGWLRWVRDSLRGRPVDIVHFLVHGNSLGTSGAILTPLDGGRERDVPVSVEASDLENFLTQVGALIAGFTRLPDNWSDFGLRLVTDEIGSRRAGPVLLHDPEQEGGFDSLREAYEFLCSPTPAAPPRSPGLAMYAQPRQVLDEQAEDAVPDAPAYEPSHNVQEHFARDETPGWLVAAQRYLEQQELSLMRFQTESMTRTPTQAEVSHFRGVQSALDKARAVVDEHAGRTL